jgi:cell division protein FtsZ
MDPNATVIWGARINPAFENKIEVITVFTGVRSPFINGGKATKSGSDSWKTGSSHSSGSTLGQKSTDSGIQFI